MHVQLDGDNWAELKEVADLRRPDRQAVNKTIVVNTDADGKPIIKASLDDDMATATLVHVVDNWSLPWPLPSVDPKSLDKLTLEQDDKLREAIQPHIDAIRGREAPVKSNEVPTNASDS